MQNPYGNRAYHRTSITTASKEQLLLMLYEACIRNFKKCKVAIEQGDIPEKAKWLGKAQDIVNELSNSLDFEKGGDIAKQLESLYLFVFSQSTEANIQNDPGKIQECIDVMETLYDGWQGAINKFQDDKAEDRPKKLDVRSK